ncbi:hypothetical protein GON26_19980 [Flavobacterium sp. GA093]|uniref:NlpE N-terminal domain-containing protein n=1 Tax=Flavobacterium hydrocarbonoxydans TaxID=2683249 RepID=A0A6I4NY16_9FLAO|nr:hypothetical protein [Flavobacterium hydrocarbonoxydans]MWB96649.1 hypothetical protein [Flavobacterium hydrocarbonoxydans]
MKKVLLLAAIICSFASCKKNTTAPEIIPSAPKEAEIVEPAGNQCYASTRDSSIVSLSFNVNSHQEVNGKLDYNLYGKDKNEGTIIGNMKGDTLIADYTFMSEGVSSVREVAFLQKDGAFIMGYGDVVESNKKVVFKDKTKLKFDADNTLVKVDCKE